MSLTVGGNKMLFTVDNTVNRSLRSESPVSFKPVGFNFRHIVGNIDFSKKVRENFNQAIGSEFRTETWQLIAGDTASYSGQGANSFPGFQERNAIKSTRYNIGAYVDLAWDITTNFMIGGAYRSEKYSDFGAANVYKVLSRLKLSDALTLRGAFSTGFRAPTLHQQYLSLSQSSFYGGEIVITGLANNFCREARLLGVPRLKAEKSANVSLGFGYKPTSNLSITADYYAINIKDRIVYGSEVSNQYVNAISFFVNAAKTRTSGVDLVVGYDILTVGSYDLNLNFAGNYRIKNDLTGGWKAVNDRVDGLPIYNQSSASLLTTSRPKYKYILGADLEKGKVSVNLNNTLFGPTNFNNSLLSSSVSDPDAKDLGIEFLPKILTDIGVSVRFNEFTDFSLTIQNILNVMPEFKLVAETEDGKDILADPDQMKEQISYITFNGRYPVLTYEG